LHHLGSRLGNRLRVQKYVEPGSCLFFLLVFLLAFGAHQTILSMLDSMIHDSCSKLRFTSLPTGLLPQPAQLQRVRVAAEVCSQIALCLALQPLIAMSVQPSGGCSREFQYSGFGGYMVQFHGVENPQNLRRGARHRETDSIGSAFGGKPSAESIAEVTLPQSFVIRLLALVPGSRTAATESVAQRQALAPRPQIGIVALARNEIRATHSNSICCSGPPWRRDLAEYRYSTEFY
jgi:hypothetical protein